MTSPPAPTIPGLPDELGGLILALALATPPAGDDAAAWRLAVAARVAGEAGDACRAALAELEAQPRAARAQTILRLVQRVTAPVPAGIARVHPSWLRAALEGEATEILVAVTAGLPEAVREVAREIVEGRGETWTWNVTEHAHVGVLVHDPAHEDAHADVHVHDQAGALDELRRAIFCGLVAMPDPTEAHLDWQRLTALPVADLLAMLARDGADTLGVSLSGAPAPVLARAAAQAGGTLAETVLTAAGGDVSPEQRGRARELVAAAVSLTRDGTSGATQAVGLVGLARRLGGELPSAAHAVAQRLPRAQGQIVLAHRRQVDVAHRG
ncbi:MAG TPA: hypothetical protein VFH68_23845 [Polyangia bacterium]|jgi:hypothetical protein|nr:hypothetical protein [Polyangia bacterium]